MMIIAGCSLILGALSVLLIRENGDTKTSKACTTDKTQQTMKKHIHIMAAAMALTVMAGCNGTKDYDNFTATLKAQPAIIDTLSTPESYAAYIVRYNELTDSFASLGVKLNPTQTDEIKRLCLDIEEHATARYNALAQTPMTLPDAMPVEETAPAAD